MADRKALITIIAETGYLDWPARLETLRITPEYDAALEVYEPTAQQLDQGAEIEELIPLLKKLSEGKLPN
jgi:hypothetical protein